MGCLGMIAWMVGLILLIIGSDLGMIYILLAGLILSVAGGVSMYYMMNPKRKKPEEY